MIELHHPSGERFFLNPDLIESVGTGPAVTLVDGRRLRVDDAPADVVNRIVEFRAAVLATAEDILAAPRARLHAVPLEPA